MRACVHPVASCRFVAPLWQLLAEHPVGSVDPETGGAFWGGTRRVPERDLMRLDPNPDGPQVFSIWQKREREAALLFECQQ